MTTKAACFPCELAEFDFWCVKLCVCLCATKQHVCVCVCVCLSVSLCKARLIWFVFDQLPPPESQRSSSFRLAL